MQDRIGSGSPGEGFAALVVSGDEVIDLADQVCHAGEGAAANCLVGDQSEEALDLVEPGTVGWDEVDMPARPLGQPSFDPRVLVRAVVVYDEMDIQPCRNVTFDPAQESQELLMPMARLAIGQHRSVEYVQSSKQRGRTMTFVVVGDSLGVAEPQRQHRLGALEGLHLTLFIHAQNQGVLGRVQVQAHHVAQFLDEKCIRGEFEALGAMRFEAKQLQVPMHTGLRNAGLGGSALHAPVGGAILGLLVQRLLNQAGHALIVERARRTGLDLIVEAADAMFHKAPAPLASLSAWG